ncbi:MAG: biopolymer transporter ExbD [Verrucomicrobiaceae bacterium]|nr:biopolymer transporter ExbD [Verrucomicrobiaceae bacterium]
MHRWTSRSQPRFIADIYLVPFMDLVFMLLFLFLILAPLMKSEWVPVARPALVPEHSVVLEPLSNAEVLLNGQKVAESALEQALKDLRASRPGVGVIVKLGAGVPVAEFARFAGVLKSAGIDKTALQAVQAP